jgi:hypothetical protein
LQDSACAGTAECDQLLYTRLSYADQGKLRGDEETGRQDEEGDHYCAEQHPLQHLGSVVQTTTNLQH